MIGQIVALTQFIAKAAHVFAYIPIVEKGQHFSKEWVMWSRFSRSKDGVG